MRLKLINVVDSLESRVKIMKTLIYAATFTLAIASSVPAAYGFALTAVRKVPHIVGSVQFPQPRWRIVRRCFRLKIP